MPCDSTGPRAAGDSRTACAGGGAAGVGCETELPAFGAEAGVEGAAFGEPAGSTEPTTAPMGRRVPGCALIDRTPATGAYSSLVALSVSSSQTASPALTAAPSGFSHFNNVACVMDSPAGVTLISTAIGVSSS